MRRLLSVLTGILGPKLVLVNAALGLGSTIRKFMIYDHRRRKLRFQKLVCQKKQLMYHKTEPLASSTPFKVIHSSEFTCEC
ncbi:hypothetical protein NQ318_011785 [Aromia moschata]|uniref:Secreted protein n=1 Tax=Aromia moschata TaxID=1265417 RepID=A0AAV8Y641_9CUCU|nr:hypothetical protein NQ318_011785 [Aromia moschata]